ncbi:hypothetical protein CSA37_01190 [Candidatus Fermentibacteria bacterium]|nr:MAG: hypothetical protein CSA37_13440 [Candidatus Fermentibacteria bacterium]PIE51902.1 MAG: hypothetical protein CSA37_08975 [Candidatus Fermentibacteria bacterium]PIE53464.1 MAG: hypothetical protein CSA37_01190 [Candidatus Fermentibacteria bacterium]
MLFGILSSASAIGIRDYNPPVSSLFDMDLSAFYSYLGQDSTTTNNGSVNYIYNNFYESLPFGWSVNSSGGLTYDGLAPDSLDETQYTVLLDGEIHKYLSGDIFGYTSLHLASQTDYDHLDASTFLGAGYGRYINATSMAKALRIQEELQEEGTINGALEDAVLIALASEIDNASSYEIQRDYYLAIEEVLEESEQIDVLEAVALYRIMQVLDNEVVRDRYYGYRVGAGVGYELSNPYSEDTEDPVMEIFGNFAYPFSLRSQFNQSALFTSNLKEFGDSYNFAATSSFSFEISDKFDDRVQYQFVADKTTIGSGSGAVSNTVSTHTITNSFIFYIENRISLNFDASLIKTTDLTLQKSVGFSIGYDLF